MNVRFLEPNIVNLTGYHTGDIALVEATTAKKLVKSGKAVYTSKPATAKPSHPEDAYPAEADDDDDDDRPGPLSPEKIRQRLADLAARRVPEADRPDDDQADDDDAPGEGPDETPDPSAPPARTSGRKPRA